MQKNKKRITVMISLFLLISNILFAQSLQKMDLKLENATLKEFFNVIESKTDYTFMYKNLDLSTPVNIDVKQAGLDNILNQVLPKINISYEISGKRIILKETQNENTGNGAETARLRISGTVKDETGETLSGVSIVLVKSKSGTVTDLDGSFVINVVDNQSQLKFSYLGYNDQIVTVGNQRDLKIVMTENLKILDEVVVVGYGSQKKVNLTGAVASVNAQELESRPITNLSQGLQGLIGNLNITVDNGAPGKGYGFNVRGTTSVNSSGPLVLVDGVQMDPNLINPADVESVSVLKDAASASIYGTQAAYGVVLITTKKGKDGGAKVSFSTNLAINSPTRIPEYLDSWSFANFHNETHRNSGGGDYYDKNYMDHIYDYYTDPKHNLPVFIDPANPNKYLYCGNTDWIEETVKKQTLMQQYTLAVSGKSDKTNYYGSVGYLDQEGTLKHYDDKYKRFNVNMSLYSDIRSWLQVKLKTTYNHTYRDAPYGMNDWDVNAAYYGADLRPMMPVYHPDGNWSGQGSWSNMAALQAISGNRNEKANDLWLTGGLKITPIKNLTFNLDYTYNVYDKTKMYHGKEILEHTANPQIVTVYPHTKPNSIKFTSDDDYYQTLRAFADYAKSFGRNNFKFLAGYDFEKKQNRWFDAKRLSLINNDLGQLGQAIGEKYTGSGQYAWSTMGYFGRINYDYDERYLLELNGRYDGSSRFPSSERFAFFPSASMAWRISNESFFKNAKNIVDELKLRASYGSLGNQKMKDKDGNDLYYPYIPTLGTNSEMSYIIDGKQIACVNPAGLVSPDLTWETVTQYDLGIDWVMFNNRFYGTYDWYQRNTYDMVTAGSPLPAVLGTDTPQENTADLRTTGWELSIGWRDRPTKDFSYNVNLILSDYQAEITKFNNPQKLLSSHYVGKKWGEIWGFETEGLFQSQEEIDNHVDQSKIYGGTWHPGDVKYKNLNGDNEISYGKNTLDDPGDQKIIGNSEPRYSFGFKTDAQWKNFDFDLFLQGVGKRDIMPGGNQFWGFGNEWHVPFKHSLDSWREDNKDAYWPRSSYDDSNGNRKTQTRYLQNAAYLRLKSITLGYTLPKSILEKIKVDNLRFYISGQNLVTFTNLLEIYDPETVNVGTYPLTKSVSFGFNITL